VIPPNQIAFQEAFEVIIGYLVMTERFNHIAPFYKRLHTAVYAAEDLPDLKSALMKLDPTCNPMDPTRVVDRYIDPWWDRPSADTDAMLLVGGVPDFMAQVWYSGIFYIQYC
jgi:hypothetical protein